MFWTNAIFARTHAQFLVFLITVNVHVVLWDQVALDVNLLEDFDIVR